jgi:hypothetical protein
VKISLPSKKYIKVLKQKDDLLFHILILMSDDSEGNYIIDRKHKGVIDKAMVLYVPEPENNDNSGRSKARI